MGSGLFHSLNIGSEALYANQQGVDTAGHNIANAQTDGFSRQRVNLEQRHPSHRLGLVIGNGVFVRNITRAHDQFIEDRIHDTNKREGESSSRFESMKGIEAIFSPELQASLSDEMEAFFSSIQDLANFPEELSSRVSARKAAQNLVEAFGRIDRELNRSRSDLDHKIQGEVIEINTLIKEIAKLNVGIRVAESSPHSEASDLRDKQDLLLRDLSRRVEVNYYRGDYGMMVVRGPSESLLVEMGNSAELDVLRRKEEGGFTDLVVVDVSGVKKAVTEDNRGGILKGLIDVRDKEIPKMLRRNNRLAHVFAESMNEVHRRGYGLNSFNETTGRDLFFFETPDRAARTLRVSDQVMETTDAISVGISAAAPGDNVIANRLLDLRTEKLLDNGNATMIEYYANMVGEFGMELVRTEHQQEADELLLADLNARRESVSGVSLDEEAANLLRWQTAFTASSKVITTVDEMLEAVLAIKR